MSPAGTPTTALLLLVDAADKDGHGLIEALRRASEATLAALEDDLESEHPQIVEERVKELAGLRTTDHTDAVPHLADTTWQLVLASLTPEEQRCLAATYEELAEGAGVAIEYGGDGAGEALSRMHAIAPAEPLLCSAPARDVQGIRHRRPRLAPTHSDGRGRVGPDAARGRWPSSASVREVARWLPIHGRDDVGSADPRIALVAAAGQ
jgi:hypothetical protein